ncbi:MAG: cytochrome c oxidase subunit II [Methylotetracoccus sp.]
MHIDPLERKWLNVAVGMVGVFVGAILLTAITKGIHPPSHVETIDSASLHLSGEFAEDKLGVREEKDGSLHVTLVAARYGFYPNQITLPADTPVTFRLASVDVLHGIHAPMTNFSTMVVPGYVSEVRTSFPKPGDYPMLCNEFCGLGHDHMWSRMTIVAKENWRGVSHETNGEARP